MQFVPTCHANPFHHVGNQRIHILERHGLHRGLGELGRHRHQTGIRERPLRIHDRLETSGVGVEALHREGDHDGAACAWVRQCSGCERSACGAAAGIGCREESIAVALRTFGE